MERSLGRSPTFLVGTETQRQNLDLLQRREQHLAEQYQKNKPLCFRASAYQKTHPLKAVGGHRDADVTLVSPMMLGDADGVSQIEEFGLDASELPRALLKACEELAMENLLPDLDGNLEGYYKGPIPLMLEAYESTECLGSTTVCLAILDNSTRIHGKLHPMIAVLSIGDCELLILRHFPNRENAKFEIIFHTEMQRIDGNAQCPLQVSRLDDRIDARWDEQMTVEVIERGSAVHCVSVYEGDIVVLGSDGVFDNLFLDEVVGIVNEMIPPLAHGSKFVPTEQSLLAEVARRIVDECHRKTQVGPNGLYPDTPIGKGGKRDDTSIVVGEIVEWTEDESRHHNGLRRQKQWQKVMTCGGAMHWCNECVEEPPEDQHHQDGHSHVCNLFGPSAREYPRGVSGSLHSHQSQESDEEDEDRRCSLM